MKKIAVAVAAIAILVAFTANPQYAWDSGACSNRITDLQADVLADNATNGTPDSDWDDGGWNWIVNVTDTEYDSTEGPESWTNLYGITALGPMVYYFKGPKKARALLTCLDTYQGTKADSDIDSGPDIFYGIVLSVATGDSTYASLAQARYDAKVASYGGADSLAMAIRDSRGSSGWDGLIPWDIGFWIWGAYYLHVYGLTPDTLSYWNDAMDMLGVIEDDMDGGYFDMFDQSEEAYTMGLAGALWSYTMLNEDPLMQSILQYLLLEMQNIDGSIGYNTSYPDGDLQATAYAIWALYMRGPSGDPAARQDAADWLGAQQHTNGGFEWDGSGEELPEVDSECLFTLMLVPLSGPLAGTVPKEDTVRRSTASSPLALE